VEKIIKMKYEHKYSNNNAIEKKSQKHIFRQNIESSRLLSAKREFQFYAGAKWFTPHLNVYCFIPGKRGCERPPSKF